MRIAQADHFPTNQSLKSAGTIHFMFGGRFGVFPKGSVDVLRNTSADYFVN
jgi:hypothetical protein